MERDHTTHFLILSIPHLCPHSVEHLEFLSSDSAVFLKHYAIMFHYLDLAILIHHML